MVDSDVGNVWERVGGMSFVVMLLEINFLLIYIGVGLGFLLVVVVVWDELVVELGLVVVVFGLVILGLVGGIW